MAANNPNQSSTPPPASAPALQNQQPRQAQPRAPQSDQSPRRQQPGQRGSPGGDRSDRGEPERSSRQASASGFAEDDDMQTIPSRPRQDSGERDNLSPKRNRDAEDEGES